MDDTADQEEVGDVGSKDELEAFLEARQQALLRYAYVLVGEPHAAQDLVQGALLEVFRRWKGIEPSGAEAYARQVITRQAWRQARRHRSDVPLDEAAAVTTEIGPETSGLEIRDAVTRLPRDQRIVIVMRYWLGHTEAETAAILGVPIGTVKSRGHRATTSLRVHLAVLDPTSTADPVTCPGEGADRVRRP